MEKGLAREVKERLSRGRSIQIDNLKDEKKSARQKEEYSREEENV